MAVILAGCSAGPSDKLIESFVQDRTGAQISPERSVDGQKKKPRGRAARARALIGKEFETYVHSLRGSDGLALVQNIEVEVPGVKLGDRIKIQITGLSKSGITVFGRAVEILGSANVEPVAGGVSPGQKYDLEILGITPAGDYYGLIGLTKTYVLGASQVGERLHAVILGLDRLEGGEDVIYSKKVLK